MNSDLYNRAITKANAVTFNSSSVYGNTKLHNNNQAGGEMYMDNLLNNTLQNKNTLQRMKRKIVYRRDERVRESLTFNKLK